MSIIIYISLMLLGAIIVSLSESYIKNESYDETIDRLLFLVLWNVVMAILTYPLFDLFFN